MSEIKDLLADVEIGARLVSGSARADADTLLRYLGETEVERFLAIGLGEGRPRHGDRISAAAPVKDGAAIHLCAFAA
jgi:hypothetical protein